MNICNIFQSHYAKRFEGGEFIMAVKIRLKRIGAKKSPFYRVVVADARYPRDGRFIEEIGTYNPLVKPEEIKIDIEKADKWIKNGAQPTDTVKDLIRKIKEEG